MDRFRNLDRYPKILLIALLALAVIFAPIYGITASRVGYLYNDEIFIPRQSEGAMVYEAKVNGQDSTIIVALDTVIVSWGSRTYGPYTLREDPTAVPDDDLAPYMTGIEILEKDTVFFRGGLMDSGDGFHLFSEDGSMDFGITVTMNDGVEYDMNGNPIDPMEPGPYDIVSLLRGPELTHKGDWTVFLIGVFFAAATAVSILFADELFYLSICFRVENAETAEPSDWYITCRNFSWTLLTIFTGVNFFMGLQ